LNLDWGRGRPSDFLREGVVSIKLIKILLKPQKCANGKDPMITDTPISLI